MNLKYSNACKEVLVLFDYFLDEDDLSKIPQKQIEHLKKNANQQYNYVIDESKTLEEQEISKEAKAIIICLYKKYFATDEQKRKIDETIYNFDKQKSIKNDNNSIFNSIEDTLNHNNSIKNNMEIKPNVTNEKSLVESNSLWKKIINKISKFFHLEK